jgi:hypothetical protein
VHLPESGRVDEERGITVDVDVYEVEGTLSALKVEDL